MKAFSWNDERTWPYEWPGCQIEPDSEEARQLAVRLVHTYDSFIAYHACRPVDIVPYYTEGLRVAQHADLLNIALAIFSSDKFPEVSAQDVLAAASQKSTIDDQKLYVALDDRELVGWSGHYLLYGSEYIIGIAAQLQCKYGRDYCRYLRSIGRPTIFELELPFEWMPKHTVMNLASDMSWAKLNDEIAHVKDFTVVLRRPVPPEFIRSHTHPTIIRDPLAQAI